MTKTPEQTGETSWFAPCAFETPAIEPSDEQIDAAVALIDTPLVQFVADMNPPERRSALHELKKRNHTIPSAVEMLEFFNDREWEALIGVQSDPHDQDMRCDAGIMVAYMLARYEYRHDLRSPSRQVDGQVALAVIAAVIKQANNGLHLN